MSGREFSERDLHVALDGEMPAEDRQAYSAWLEAHPDMKARSARFADDRRRLREALGGIENEPAPRRLTALLETGESPARTGTGRRWRRAAAATALVLAGGVAGYGLGTLQRAPGTGVEFRLADGAIAAHAIYSNEKLHVVEVGADQRDHLVGWLSKRLGMTLTAPDLDAQGFELVGGRLLPSADKTAAQFMYQDATGGRISLYVIRDEASAETGFRILDERGIRAVYWLDEGYGCAVAGAIPEATLLSLADAVYRQLLNGEQS